VTVEDTSSKVLTWNKIGHLWEEGMNKLLDGSVDCSHSCSYLLTDMEMDVCETNMTDYIDVHLYVDEDIMAGMRISYRYHHA
jgi:hypothetical protein